MSWSNILKAKVRIQTAEYFESLLPDEFDMSPLHPDNLNNDNLFQDALEDTDTTIKGWEVFFSKFKNLSGKPLRVALRKETKLNPNVYDDDVEGTIEDYISNILEEAYPKFSERLSKKKKEEQKPKEKPVEETIEENVGDTIRFRITGDTSFNQSKVIKTISDEIQQIKENMDKSKKDLSSEALNDMSERIKELSKTLEKIKSKDYDALDDDDSEVKSNIEELLSLISDEAERIEVKTKKPITYENSVEVKSKGKQTVLIIDTQIPLRKLNLQRQRYGKNKDFESGTEYIVALMRKTDSKKENKFLDVYKKLKQSLNFSMDDLGITTKDFFRYEFELRETKDFPLIQSLIKRLSNDKKLKFRSKYAQSSLFDATFLDSNTGDLNPNIKALIQSSDESWADGIGKLSAYSQGDNSTVVATELRSLVTELEPVIVEGQTIPKTETNKIVIDGTSYTEITPKAVKEFFSREYLMSDADLKFITTGTGYKSDRRSDNARKLSTYLEEKNSTLANLRTLFNNRIKRVSRENKDFADELEAKISEVSELGYEIIENKSKMLNSEVFVILNYFEYLEELDNEESKSIISEFERYSFKRQDSIEDKDEEILLSDVKKGKRKLQSELTNKIYYLVYDGDSPYDANNLLSKLELAFKKVPPRSIKGARIVEPKMGATFRRKFNRERPDLLQFSRKIRSVKVDIKENVPQLLELFTEVANKVGTTEQALINHVANDPTTQNEFSFATFISLPAYIERKIDEKEAKQFRAFTSSVVGILSAIKEGDDKDDIEDDIEDFIDEVVSASSKMLELYVKESMDYLRAFLASLSGESLSYVNSVKRIVRQSALVPKFEVITEGVAND